MTRLKTICLLAIAYVYAFSITAQSNSCVSSLNVSVDPNCEFALTPETLRSTGEIPGSIRITTGFGTGSGTSFVGGVASFSATSFDIPDDGIVGYQLFASDDGTGPMLCWGELNLELKSIPGPETKTWEIMCGQPIDLPTIEEVEESLTGLCVAPISGFSIQEIRDEDNCSADTTIRIINATIDLTYTKITTALRIDTIIETPLSGDMIIGPLGGPTKQDAIILTCDDIGNAYPTPAIVEEFSEEGVFGAYPYIPKKPDTTIVMVDAIVQVLDTMKEQQLIVDDFGDEYLIWVKVVRSRDTLIQIPDTTITERNIILRGEPICNLSVSYKDQQFPGCAGPDSKIFRTWTVLDWCSGDIDSFFHWIVVETEGPIIDTIPDAFAPLAPWVCTASFPLSATVDRGCSETLEVIFQTSVGVIEDNKILTGLWLGEVAEVEVIAIDDCGQRTIETFTVTPIDSIAPVAIAEDQVNVSLSGDPVVVDPEEDRGVAKVFIDAIDAGSHNSGCGEVDRCLLLKEELEDPVIIDNIHIEVDGRPIYHAKGCLYDGIIPADPGTKNRDPSPAIPYVYCKDNVKFCCESLGFNNVAMVVTNGSGAKAITWTQVLVEDKTSSFVICPQDFTVGCDSLFEIPQPSLFNGVCGFEELEMTMTEDFDQCGNGTKTVIWTNNSEVVCTLVITVDGESGFNPYEIKWPKHFTDEDLPGIRRECELLVDDDGDAILDDDGNEQYVIVELEEAIRMGQTFECEDGASTGEPTWCTASCGLIGVNFEDQSLAGIEACRKVVRKWTIIDWCTWDPNQSNIDDENDSFDTFTPIDDEWLGADQFLTDARTTEGEACEICEKPSGEQDFIYFRYDRVDVDGYYTFDQVIKILDFDDPIITAPDTVTISIVGGATSKDDDFDECFASDIVAANAIDLCGGAEIDASDASWIIEVYQLGPDGSILIDTDDATGTVAQTNTQVGRSGDVHLIRWLVRDGCGNIGRAETFVLFVEDKKPTPICIATLSTATMNSDGISTIWAADFDAGSFDNCSEVDLFFKDDEGNFTPSLTFECGDLEGGVNETFTLELFAVDALGNHDFCNVDLRVDDFNDNCPDLNNTTSEVSVVAGAIQTIAGDRVEDVEVALDYGPNFMTEVNGDYMFQDLTFDDFEISANRDDDHINGVTALDLVLIQRHLLGLTRLDDPYKIIAADINSDGRVSALDMVDLRRLILGTIDEFPSNSSWRFVVANQQFPDPTSPFPFTEVISIRDFDGQEMSQNFIAIKIGDINTNAIANSLQRADNRSAGRLSFVIEDRQMSAGEIAEVSVRARNFEDIMAYQHTLRLEGLELVNLISGDIDVDETMLGVHEGGLLTTTWTMPYGVSTDQVLYTMTIMATEDIKLSEGISISSDITESKAYRTNQTSLDIEVLFENAGSLGVALDQNVPNPFDDVTTIGFDLPESGFATLSVYDVTGQKIYEHASSYAAGSHQVRLGIDDLQRIGVLYYQLEYKSDASGDHVNTEVKKMIVLR